MKKILLTIVAVLLVIGIAGVWVYISVLNTINTPFSASEYPVKFEIRKGMNPSEIADLLVYLELIKSKKIFLWEVKREEAATKLQAGYFTFTEPNTMPEVIEKLLTEGKIPPQKYTFLEGLTIDQFADALKKREEIDNERYRTLAKNHKDLFNFKFSKNIPEDADLEGYLFPQTYLIEEPTAEKIIQTKLTQFEKIFDDSYVARCKELGLTIHECVTFASIVQAESGNAEEMPLISSVFWNRLNKSWKLECNATLAYSLKIDGYMLSTKQLRTDDPYNTYKYPGLPPGPICSPGQDAIHAVLYPAESDYFFFVATGNGTSVFAKTLSEHNANIRKYLR